MKALFLILLACTVFEYRGYRIGESALRGFRVYDGNRFVFESKEGGMMEAIDFIDWMEGHQ